MPLQIRRGTEAQRTSPSINLKLAEGELLWITDDQKLYIGIDNGVTPAAALTPVTGYNDEQAQDAVGTLLQAGPHQGIAFTYNDIAGTLSAVVDLSNYSGVITGDIVGSVFADNSSMLVNGTNGQIILDGTVKGHIVPNANEQYDLGSSSFRFRDLYLSGASIELGDAIISATGTAINLPLGSTIGGLPLGVSGGDLNVNIVADDSSIMVNTTTETITASSGFFGDLIADEINIGSSTISPVDNFDGEIAIQLGTESSPSKVIIYGTETPGSLILSSISDSNTLQFRTSGSSITSPQIPDPEAALLVIDAYAYTGHSLLGLTENWAQAGTIRFEVNDSATINSGDGYVKGSFVVTVFEDSTGSVTSSIGLENKSLITDVPIIPGSFTTAQRDSEYPSPVEGMMIYNSTTKKFQGYSGDAGGGNPGWVDLN
jgi:hypothetical protein